MVRYTPAHPDLFGAALFQRCLGVFFSPPNHHRISVTEDVKMVKYLVLCKE